jgi:hypothetical protein
LLPSIVNLPPTAAIRRLFRPLFAFAIRRRYVRSLP